MSSLLLKRMFRLGITNFWRNGWLSVASCLVIAITIFIVGISTIQTIVLLKTTQGIKEKLDLAVYFNDGIDEEIIKESQKQIAHRDDVKNVDYITKEKAYEIWQQQKTPEKIKGLITAENNPLPRSLNIKTYNPEDLAKVAQVFQEDKFKDAVRRITYQDNQSVIESLIVTANKVKRNGIILTIIFIVISFILIYNTTKIVILSRKDEIEIMRLVGATDIFVKLPFLIEATIFGILGVVLALPLIYLFLRYDLASSSPILSFTKFLAPDMLSFTIANIFWLAPTLFFVSILLSTTMSYVAVRKYVKI